MAASRKPSLRDGEAQRPRLDLFVSMDGNDGWSGRFPDPTIDGADGPFRSLERARAVATTAPAPSRPSLVTVQIRGGRYYLPDAAVASLREDAAAATARVAYTSYSGEEALFSAGSDIPGWQRRQEWYLTLYAPPARASSGSCEP